jgi:cytochrome c biogenesis protein CcmG/thiol:disulfide interchange protein DsbE
MTIVDDRPAADVAARPLRAAHRGPVTLTWVAMVAAIVLGAGYALGQAPARPDGAGGAAGSDDTQRDGPVVGAPAPALVVSTIDGRVINLTDLRGRPVWLTFGASWCQACRAENPDIESAFHAAADGDLAVIAVFISEDNATVADYARLVGLTYEKVADPDRDLAGRYLVVGLPSHFFIDRLGVVRGLRVGSLDPAGIQQELGEILR